MSKPVILIDKEKCVGCGLCANTCHQSAIAIVEGKAQVVREDFCDGLGRCLPVCPTNAISFAETEVKSPVSTASACPSTKPMEKSTTSDIQQKSQLNQWPVQIKLVSTTAPYFTSADLLVAADCTAFSYSYFHQEFMKDKTTIIGCPKLDEADYSVKLTEIFTKNELNSVTVARMEVPCCGGIERAVVTALKNSGKSLPLQVVTFSIAGEILE